MNRNPTTTTEAGAVADVAAKPVRVQLRRTKGWRMPANTVKVDRTTKWGNPHDWRDWRDAWPFSSPSMHDGEIDRDTWCKGMAYEAFAEDVRSGEIKLPFDELRGKNLACWCRLNGGLVNPCHADVLLELANAPVRQHLEQGATAS